MLLDGFDYILEKIPYFDQSVAYGVVEVGEHSEGIDRGKTRGSDRRRVKTEIVLCVWVEDACREGKDGRGNRHSDKRRRPSDR